MYTVNDVDREAAARLREILADISGFWLRPGDADALCQALARHRTEAEGRVIEKLTPFIGQPLYGPVAPAASPVGEQGSAAPRHRAAMTARRDRSPRLA